MSAAKETTFTLPHDAGADVFLQAWLPAEDATAVLQIVHGMAEHIGRYAELAQVFVKAGFAVYGHDQRGHGKSIAEGDEAGHMGSDGFVRATNDVGRLHQEIVKRHPNVPVMLLGHSMGSFMAQRVLLDDSDKYAGVALSASNGKPPLLAQAGRGVARIERLRLGKRGKSKLLNTLSFEDFNKRFKPNRTGFDWLSRDEVEVDKYVDDPLCGFEVSVQTWVDLLDAMSGLSEPTAIARIPKDKPVYVLAGTRDAVGDMGRGVARLVDAYRAAWLTNITVKMYPDGRHEMFHEHNRDEVMADLLAWCNKTARGQDS